MSGSSVTDVNHSMSEKSAADAASITTHSSSSSVAEPTNSTAAGGTRTPDSGSVLPQNPFDPDSTTKTPSTKPNDVTTSTDPVNTISAGTASAIPPISPARSVSSSASVSSPSQTPRMPAHPLTPVTPVQVEAPSPRQPQSAPVPSSSNNFPTATTPAPQAVSERRPRGGAVDLDYRPQQPIFDDDETTQPSSAGNTTEQQQSEKAQNMAESIARFMQNTRRRLSSTKDSDDDDDDFVEGAIIAGYLQKLGRNGKWQMRWFETDGECLSYYKSSKRTKLLATLDLEKVGAIGIDESDLRGCSFGIEVLGRLYHLRADSRASCRDWVITLNRVKEARMQQGNVKLVDPACHQPPDLLDQNTDIVAPRVVVVANRQRTRAVDETQEFERLMHPESDLSMTTSMMLETKRRSTIGTVVLARWSKRKSSFQRLSAKLVKWARSVKRFGCDQMESVQLDRHVHPPGHDDHRRRQASGDANAPAKSTEALDAWIGKEASQSAAGGQAPPLTNSKPKGMRRGLSEGSEDDARYLS